jgi:hypothetical protein
MRTSIFFFAALLALSACEGADVKETLGLERNPPDEFVVVSRPPLSVPPEFKLRPPAPGELAPQESTRAKAEELLRANPSATLPVESEPLAATNDAVFLERAGTNVAEPNIRQKLGVDSTKKRDTSMAKTLLDKLDNKQPDQPVVDAKKEADRIRKNKAQGKKINEGEIPTTNDTKKPTLIDRLF